MALEKENPPLHLAETGTWLNSSIPFVVGTPDALVLNQENQIVAVVEYKSFSTNNYPGKKHDSQISGQVETAGVEFGILVKMKKVRDPRIQVKIFRSGIDTKTVVWNGQTAFLYSCLREHLGLGSKFEDFREVIERALIWCGYEKPKKKIENFFSGKGL